MRTVAEATGRRERGVELVARGRRADRPREARRARRSARPRVAALEWLDPVVRRRPLDAAADRAGRRRGRARARRRALRDRLLGGGRRRAAGGRGGDALRLRRPARARGGARTRSTSWPRWAPGGSSPSTPRPTSPGPGRGWSTGSSCSRTSCIPSSCPRRREAPAVERSTLDAGGRCTRSRPLAVRSLSSAGAPADARSTSRRRSSRRRRPRRSARRRRSAEPAARGGVALVLDRKRRERAADQAADVAARWRCRGA